MNLRIISALALAASAFTAGVPLRGQAPAGTLSERIERITSRPEFRHALWGIEFYSLDAKQPVYSQNADKLFTPGSTTKLLTEGTALALLGADYRFRTRVYRTGSIGADGTLNGDLVLVASGDPNLSGRIRPDGTLAFENEDHSYDADPNTRAVPGDPLLAIRELAQQVVAHNIKKVSGNVLVDASLFRGGDRELGTGVVISPIVVNDNLVDVTITPGASAGAPLTVEVSPATAYVRFVNDATTGAAGSRQFIRWATDSMLPDESHVVTMRGSMPAGGQKILFSYAVPSPRRFAEVVFAEALRAAGVSAEARGGAAPMMTRPGAFYVDSTVVAEHVSPPMSEEVKVTLKVSQNLHASMTPRLVGAIVGKKDTARAGFDLEREFLKGAGLDLSGAQQADGAGGDAHFTPAFMVSYLTYMATRPDYAKFLAALPILGRDGTLFDIQPSSPAAGHVFAKTGTYSVGDPLNRAMLVTGKGLAGYMTTVDGHRLAFAVYVNNVGVPAEPDAVKRIVGQALGEVAAAAYDATPATPSTRAMPAPATTAMAMPTATITTRSAAAQSEANRLTAAERAAGWRLLFDGRTFKGWRGLGYDSVPTAHWTIENGAIKKIASGNVPKMPDGQPANGGDLISADTFGDFELAWQWKVTPGANSGLKYNVSEEFSLKHASNHAALGFEYQILDDSLSDDNKLATHRAGALYELIPPNEKKRLRPVGEWNSSRLVFRGNHGEHWLNGAKLVEFDLGTAGMDSALAKSKYRTIPGFAERRRGHIILQDHGDEVYFRDIKVREIK